MRDNELRGGLFLGIGRKRLVDALLMRELQGWSGLKSGHADTWVAGVMWA